MANKTEEIKVRVEPLDKLVLQQIAEAEGLVLSDMARRAIGEFIRSRTTPMPMVRARGERIEIPAPIKLHAKA